MPELSLINYLLAIIGFLIVYVLNGIKNDISDMKKSLHALSADLWSEISQIKSEIVALKTRCGMYHDDTN